MDSGDQKGILRFSPAEERITDYSFYFPVDLAEFVETALETYVFCRAAVPPPPTDRS